MTKLMFSAMALVLAAVGAGVISAGAAGAADHPGQKFQISAGSLAKPYATPAVGNESTNIPRPAEAMPDVPQGFAVSVFAQNLSNARWMAVAPNGDVFLAEPTRDGGKITVLRDSNGDGKADKTFTFLSSGFVYPHGLAFHDGYLYVGDLRGIWRFAYTDGQTSAGKPEKVTSKVADLRPKGGHVTRDIAFGPDGGLYLALGSRDNISDFKPGAQVFKINADGSMSEFASGIRNPVGIAFAPGTNTLYVVVKTKEVVSSVSHYEQRLHAINITTGLDRATSGVVTLGDPIINPSSYGDAGRLGAAILVAALAIAAEVGLSAVQRKLTPEGLRLTEQAASGRRLLSIPKRRIAPTS